MKKVIVAIIAVLVVAVGFAHAQDIAPVAAAQTIYENPRPLPVIPEKPQPRVSWIINDEGHCVMYDENGIAIDLDRTAYLFDKLGDIMRLQAINQARAAQEVYE